MTTDECKFMHWFCDGCETDTIATGKAIHLMKIRQEKFEAALETTKADIELIKAKMIHHDNDIAKKVNKEEFNLMVETKMASFDSRPTKEEIMTMIEVKLAENDLKQQDRLQNLPNDKSWTAAVSRHVETKFERVTGDIDSVKKVLEETKQKALEEREKELRSNNIIIYRVPEGAESRDDRNKSDKAFILELISEALEIECHEGDIKKFFRIGKKGEVARPLLIELKARVYKNRIMESLSKLREADEKFKNISVSHDMTKSERMECKTLVEEAKKKQNEEKGEWLWRVRGVPGLMKVIRIAKH